MPMNYEALTGMANGIKEGMLAYQTNKQINHQNKMEGLLKGVQTNPETGELEFTPQMQAQREQEAKLRGFQVQEAERKAQEGIGGSEASKQAVSLTRGLLGKGADQYLPEGMSAAQVKEYEPMISAKLRREGMGGMLGVREFNAYSRAHENAIGKINNDKQLNATAQSLNNLDNARALAEGERTPQAFHELQQAIRGNIGIKGNSIGSERVATYLDSVGIKKDEFLQKLTGNPQDVAKSDPKMWDIMMHVVEIEQQNKREQAKAQINKLTAGQRHLYTQQGMRDYKGDYDQTVNSLKQQLGIQEEQQAAAGGPTGRTWTPGRYEQDVMAYAREHGITNDQAQAIKEQRMGRSQSNNQEAPGFLGKLKGMFGG